MMKKPLKKCTYAITKGQRHGDLGSKKPKTNEKDAIATMNTFSQRRKYSFVVDSPSDFSQLKRNMAAIATSAEHNTRTNVLSELFIVVA